MTRWAGTRRRAAGLTADLASYRTRPRRGRATGRTRRRQRAVTIPVARRCCTRRGQAQTAAGQGSGGPWQRGAYPVAGAARPDRRVPAPDPPLVLGSGQHLFPAGTSAAVRLTSSVTTTTGVMIATYQPAEPAAAKTTA